MSSATGVELASAWVRLVPSMEGVQGEVAKAFAPAAKEAEKAGTQSGKGWSGKAKAAMVAGSAVLVAGVVAGFKGLYEVGATFDDVTDTIRVGTGAQGEALDGLVDVAKNVGKTVPAEFSAIGSTVADLNTRLGLSGDTLQTVASQYLEAGRMLGQEVDINKTSAAFSAFKIEGDAVVGAMDNLFQVSQATGVGMNELAQGIAQNAPALSNLGFSFQDSISLLGSLDKAGLNSQQVMASLSKGLVTLAKDGEEPQAAFKRVTGEIQGFVDTGDTAAALDLASKVFGTRGATQFVGALQSGVLNMEDLMAATGATGDTILGVGEETMDFTERWQILMNQAMTAIEPLATAVFTAVGDGLAAVMPMFESFGSWLSENLWVVGAFAAVIGTVLVAAIAAWTAGVIANTIAMLAWPVTWIILAVVAAIALLVAAAIWLWNNWDAVIAWIAEAWQGFMDWIGAVIDGFVAWWNSVWSAVGQWITDVWNGFIGWITDTWTGFVNWLKAIGISIKVWWNALWKGIGDWITNIWNGFIGMIRDAFNNYVNWLKSIGNGIATWWNNLWSGIGQWIADVWDGIVTGVKVYLAALKLAITTIVNGIKTVWNNIWNGIASFFGGIWDGIVSAVEGFGKVFSDIFGGIKGIVKTAFSGVLGIVKGPINGIIGLLNRAIGALNGISVSIPDWVPVVGGQTFGLSLPKIPMLAEGGTILQPGLTIVGENGPEMLRLPRGAVVDPDIPDMPRGGTTFNNYAPLGRTPAQALTEFANREKGLF